MLESAVEQKERDYDLVVFGKQFASQLILRMKEIALRSWLDNDPVALDSNLTIIQEMMRRVNEKGFLKYDE
jgi:hypothetical protein